MELIEQIIYLGRVKSAIDDMQAMQEHGINHVTMAKRALLQVHEELEHQIKAHPEGHKFVAFDGAEP